jgi:dolichol-phosphate mannosyltransferase
MKKIDIVTPIFNEASNIEAFVSEVHTSMNQIPDVIYRIIFIDDGSCDGTYTALSSLFETDDKVSYISLSRNFGHQNALRAGLEHSSADAIITLDGDLQHPPSLIIKLISLWKEGFDIVYTERDDEQSTNYVKRWFSKKYYQVFSYLSKISIKEGSADFRLLNRNVVDAITDMKEFHLFFRGIVPWTGFNSTSVRYTPQERLSGESKYTVTKMLKFAITGITSFSTRPLKLGTALGMILSLLSLLYGTYAFFARLLVGRELSGWTSVIMSILFIGGIQLIILGIIGEYVGKIYEQVKQRPHYLIKEKKLKDF